MDGAPPEAGVALAVPCVLASAGEAEASAFVTAAIAPAELELCAESEAREGSGFSSRRTMYW